MITISCTKKLFEVSSFIEEQNDESIDELFKWHANIFRLERKNNLIVINNKTRYGFILFGVKKEHFKRFNEIFINSLVENLRAEGVEDSIISKYVSRIDHIKFAKTNDRSVIGSMVDVVKMTEIIVGKFLPIKEMNIVELNKNNNKCPVVKLNIFPNDYMKETLNNYFGPADLKG
ncbi:DUF6933 domain-containing protein [Cohnella abietis]|uniref:DUF6933 domain-containing protein n=1 Tax=Cohnella abietis TaxID=2507935 RepID=A0A3T1D8E5_9BACL|nr:hypothetical protein [Cohnella abietis]BBI34325.1 hypothetical protein KCTCHS21_37240 [Cohnella abietis]